jgi:serine/threonine protein kinase
MNNYLFNILRNEYKFIKVLHKSQKGEIKLYRHKNLNKNLVIHTLDNAPVRVYKALKKIKHKNIIQVFEVLETDEKTLVIEEYIDGMNLSEFVGIINPLGVKRVIRQLCEGLSVLHSIGIVHRDITLNNIMLDEKGTVKIIDFDIAKLYKSNELKDSNSMGTAGYAPFEQMGIASTDEHTDIFAVGITANLLLTGKHPSVQIYTKGRLGKMIEICTNINPQKRFSSCDEILNFLK